MYTGTRLTTAIHRRLLSRFFLTGLRRLYTGYFVCTGEFLWKSLSLQQNFAAAACCKKSNQSEFVGLVAAQSSSSSVVETKISRNSPVHTKRFVAGMCRPNRVAATSRPSCTHGARGLSPRLVAVSCRLVCFDLYSIITIQLHKKRNTKRSKYCLVKSSQKAKGL